MDPEPSSTATSGKTPVVRGARACTTCRQAKMKCVVSEDGNPRCQRCIRSNVECIFEKHRRGRKPGSKLSEASKMLRRLEKGYNSAKARQPVAHPSHTSATSSQRDNASGSGVYAGPSSRASPSDDEMDEDADHDGHDEALYPATVIRTSSSFLDVVMNPSPPDAPRPLSGGSAERANSQPKKSPSPAQHSGLPPINSRVPYSSAPPGSDPKDPVEAGIIPQGEVQKLFDLFFIRLNPFINLFDASLHSPDYVRSKSPFLFTTMIMACCKFFRPDAYHDVRKLAQEFATHTFTQGIESVEVTQAFACLTYWQEPHDQRTWTYIGMACRMAVGLRLNKYVGRRQHNESELSFLERRNRERTYLVLFVHDRSLSMQTGKQWMLHEDDLVRSAGTWHLEGKDDACRPGIRPEDVILSSFVKLRLLGSHMTDKFYNRTSAGPISAGDLVAPLRECNYELDQWKSHWTGEMEKADDYQSFHIAFITFFMSHVRLFLNHFGIINGNPADGVRGLNSEAVHHCYESAAKNLQIVSKDFAAVGVLRYSQESITTMTAYAAIMLLKLLRGPRTGSELKPDAAEEIHGLLNKAADAYKSAGQLAGSELTSAAYHARFLRRLAAQDLQAAQPSPRGLYISHGPGPQGFPPLRTAHFGGASAPASDVRGFSVGHGPQGSQVPILPPLGNASSVHGMQQHYYSSDPSTESAMRSSMSYMGGMNGSAQREPYSQVAPADELDDHYSRSIFRELGLGEDGAGALFPNAEFQLSGSMGGFDMVGMPYPAPANGHHGYPGQYHREPPPPSMHQYSGYNAHVQSRPAPSSSSYSSMPPVYSTNGYTVGR